jgi:cell division protein FtsL
MPKNRSSQSVSIRFGPALKALGLCLLIAGSAVGYVWKKSQNYHLGKQIHQAEVRLAQLADENKKLADELSDLRSPVKLDQRARSLGLAPAQPTQVVRLAEPLPAPPENNSARKLAARSQ